MDFQELYSGAISFNKVNGVTIPYRFTSRQLSYYNECAEAWGVRARCTSGIRLDFLLEEESFSFDYEASDFCRPKLWFDIYENGVLTQLIKEEDHHEKGRVIYHRRSQDPASITLYLSQNANVVLKNARLGKLLPPKDRPLYLALGDSITQGMDASAPSFTYPAILSRYYDWDFINQGVGGFVFEADSLDDSFDFSPQIVTIAYGVNDSAQILLGNKTHDGVSKKIEDYLNKIKMLFPQSKVYVISPIWWSKEEEDPDAKKLLREIRKELAAKSEDRGFIPLNGLPLVSHHPDFFEDKSLHPNEIGFMQYAMNLTKEIKG